MPESQNFGYDSYATLDVKDKIVIVLRYFPEDADQKTKAILTRYSDLRYKAMAARQRGAKGMLVVTGPSSPNAGETIPMTFDTALSGSGIAAASISGAVADAIFGSLGDTGQDARRGAESARFRQSARRRLRHPQRDRAPQAGRARARRAPRRTSSPICRRRRPHAGRREAVGRRSAPTTIISATAKTATRWRPKTTPARSTSARTTTRRDQPPCSPSARCSRRAPRKRNVLLEFWSGEELGLLGSTAYVNSPRCRSISSRRT